MVKHMCQITVCFTILSKKIRLIGLIVISIALMTLPCHASNIEREIYGLIKDKNDDRLPGVSVALLDKDGNTVSYAISDSKGAYKLVCPKIADGYKVSFSCLGYKQILMCPGELKNGMIITMDEDAVNLKDVTVSVPPIKVKGDTLTYNVASFKNASDRSIEDIIRKLPGINVSEDGRIYYNGESINKFYIEGVDLLSGRYALASRNISPDDVSEVNIYENHQSKRVLKDIKYSDKAAINLKLKNKSLLRPIGYVKGGSGFKAENNGEALWLGEIFGLLVSPKSQMLISGKTNNSGQSYINETGSLTENDLIQNTYASGMYSTSPFGEAGLPKSRFIDNQSVSSSVNTTIKLNEFSQFNIIADYTDEKYQYDNGENIEYTMGGQEKVVINETARNRPHQRSAKFKMKLENNSLRKYISEQLSFVGHFDNNRYAINDGNLIKQNVSSRDYNMRNALYGILKLSNHLIDFKSDIQFGESPTNTLLAIKEGEEIVCQNLKGRTFRSKEEVEYSWLINSKSYLGLNLELDFGYETFKSISVDSGQLANNDLKSHNIVSLAKPHYQCKINENMIFNFSVPLKFSNLKYKNLLSEKYYSINKFDVDFKAQLNYTTPFNLKTVWIVGHQNNLGGLSDYILNPIYTTFRDRMVPGSGEMTFKKSYYVNSSMSYRNAVEGVFSSATIMFRHGSSNKLGSMDIENTDILTKQENLKNDRNHLNASFSISKNFMKWKTIFAFNGSYELLSHYIGRQDNIIKMKSDNIIGRININSSPINDYLIMILDYKYSYSRQNIYGAESYMSTIQNQLSLSLASHPIKRLELSLQTYYNNCLMDNTSERSSVFVDCKARYKIGPLDIELNVNNIFNTKRYSYIYINNADVYSYTYSLRPIEFLSCLRYSF